MTRTAGPAWAREERSREQVRKRANLRLGHGGQGTQHGWTKEGKRIRALHRKGKLKACPICGESLLRQDGKRLRNPYHKGCANAFYERFYRAWHLTQQIVSKRSRGRCERCGKTADEASGGSRWLEDGFTLNARWHKLEYDHIVEVAAGGDPLDPENVQHLCHDCHRRKTKAFARRGFKVPSAPMGKVRPLEAFA